MKEADAALADEPLDGKSLDIAAEKRRAILDLFPEARTEGDQVDFERLRIALGDTIDTGKERYGLTWPGKAACFRAIQSPSMATLLPRPEKSISFDTTENVIIEGDNLEVLKLLQKSYLGTIKTIYIDPPYNTGNDFIYPDDYSESVATYLQYTMQADGDGKKFATNSDSDGRFHSKWLTMMYSRLYLARNLLRDDGLIFASIDDSEVDNLRFLLNSIFGEENRVESFIWKKSYGGGAKERYAVTQHEYILLYAKSIASVGELSLPPDEQAEARYYKYKDERFPTRGPFRIKPLEATKSMDRRENLIFPIKAPDGTEVWPKKQWWWSKERVTAALANNELWFTPSADGFSVSYKQYLRNEDGIKRSSKPFSVLDGPYTQTGTADLAELFGGEAPMQFPKPVDLIKRLIQIGDRGKRDGIVLDFFAGSGTTAQAVYELNNEDAGNRRFILVQIPEPTGQVAFATIADLAEERARRSSAKILKQSSALELGKTDDLGFRVFTLDRSTIEVWNATVDHTVSEVRLQLTRAVEHIRPEASDLDVLFELLLKSGYTLAEPILIKKLLDAQVFWIANGSLAVCLAKKVNRDLIRAIADLKPVRVMLLDAAFDANDQLKTNAIKTFETAEINFRSI